MKLNINIYSCNQVSLKFLNHKNAHKNGTFNLLFCLFFSQIELGANKMSGFVAYKLSGFRAPKEVCSGQVF